MLSWYYRSRDANGTRREGVWEGQVWSGQIDQQFIFDRSNWDVKMRKALFCEQHGRKLLKSGKIFEIFFGVKIFLGPQVENPNPKVQSMQQGCRSHWNLVCPQLGLHGVTWSSSTRSELFSKSRKNRWFWNFSKSFWPFGEKWRGTCRSRVLLTANKFWEA